MAASRNLKDAIRAMLSDGKSNRSIVAELGVSGATVSYHAKKMGFSKGSKPQYDWNDFERRLASGDTVANARQQMGMSKGAVDKARKRGAINYLTASRMSAAEYADIIQGRAKPHHRRILRAKLIKEGRPRKCEICGISTWNGARISLEVDHKDGDAANNKLENLRLLCPNCHSQTDTWRGRNKRRY